MVSSIVPTSPRCFRIDWVLLDALAVGPAPRATRHLQQLHHAGIRAIFSLCGDDEAPSPPSMEESFCCKRLVLPDHHSAELLELGQLEEALQQLATLCQVGPVFVHCVAAMERSPLLCMAWLVQTHGLSPTEALDYLMQVHPGTNPLPRQLALLRQLNCLGVTA